MLFQSCTLSSRAKRPIDGLQKAVCLLAPAGVCSLLYLGLQPRKISPMYALGTGLIYAAWIAITRAFLLERQYTVSPLYVFTLLLPSLESRFA